MGSTLVVQLGLALEIMPFEASLWGPEQRRLDGGGGGGEG